MKRTTSFQCIFNFFFRQTSPLFHSGGVTELAASYINVISPRIHRGAKVNKAFVFSGGSVSAKVH